MDYLERKKKGTNKCFGSTSSCKDNYGRESNFETMDGKVQCSETIGHNVFLQGYHWNPPHGSLLQYSCSLPFSEPCTKTCFPNKLFSPWLLQCTAGRLSEQSVTNGGYHTWSKREDEFRLLQRLTENTAGAVKPSLDQPPRDTAKPHSTKQSVCLSVRAFSGTAFLCQQLCQVNWDHSKALLEDCRAAISLVCSFRLLGLGQMLTLLLMHPKQHTGLDHPVTSSKSTGALPCPQAHNLLCIKL